MDGSEYSRGHLCPVAYWLSHASTAMKNGDLSNRVVPRSCLIFEGALGHLAVDDSNKFARHIRKKRWDKAVELWEIDPLMARKIWDVVWRLGQSVEVLTYAGPPAFAAALEERLTEDEELPITRVRASTPELIARKLAFWPDVRAVYDPDPERVFTYGGKGRYLRSPIEFGE